MATGNTIRRIITPAGDPAWLVTGYEDVRTLFADARLGRSHPDPDRAPRYTEAALLGGPMGNAATEAADHSRMRKLLAPSFAPRRMASLRARVEHLVHGCFDEMERRGPPVDFHDAVSFPLPAAVICDLLGVPFADRDQFRRWSDDVGTLGDGARSRAGMAALKQYVAGLLEQKRAQPADDVFTDLVRVQGETPEFTAESAAGLAAGLLFAGHETTAAAIDRGVLLLLANPRVRDAMVSDPELVAAAVEEIVRLPNPVGAADEKSEAGLPRYANADIAIGDITIRAGELVLLNQQAANLDPHVFRAPAELDLEREQEHPHLAFGFGAHYCVGAPLARLELSCVFGALFQRFPTLALAVPVEEIRARTGTLTGGVEALPVTWQRSS